MSEERNSDFEGSLFQGMLKTVLLWNYKSNSTENKKNTTKYNIVTIKSLLTIISP